MAACNLGRIYFGEPRKSDNVRDGPFSFQGGGMFFFSKKNILILNVAEKNILILVEEKQFI
jgi:hypothetical protein